MKLTTKQLVIIGVISVTAFIGIGLLFIHYGFEDFFIHKLPNLFIPQNRCSYDSYDSLLNLYQTRINIVNWGIACIGAMLTFLAFYVQYDYNNRQKEDLAQERFENQLFHLLDVYRDICNNASIKNAGNGKVAFHYMFYEYKAIFYIILKDKDILNEILKNDKNQVDIETINYIAFTYFINGVSANKIDTTIEENIISPKGKELISKKLLQKQNYSIDNQEKTLDETPNYLKDYSCQQIKYFDGHRPRFVPYIKYITLILEFIATKSPHKKDNYIKFLFKEQTDHEIGLIYAYNGYCKYRELHTITGNLNDKNQLSNNNNIDDIWENMYDDITKHMEYKFKYNMNDFIS